MYTDLNNKKYVIVDIKTLIQAYEYAGKVNNSKMIAEIGTLISNTKTEVVSILKGTELHQFLKSNSCPTIQEDQVSLDMIEQALINSYYQNNRSVRASLATILSKWREYANKGQAKEGMEFEISKLSENIIQFILKYGKVNYRELKEQQLVLIQPISLIQTISEKDNLGYQKQMERHNDQRVA